MPHPFRRGLSIAVVGGVLATVGYITSAQQGFDPTLDTPAPVVELDKADYQPADTALITGRGFHPNELVTLQVTHYEGLAEPGAGHDPWEVVSDASGSFSTEWYVNPDDSAGQVLLLTARDAEGWNADRVFTDGSTTVVVSAVETGWYKPSNRSGSSSYLVGNVSFATFRDFFVFTMPSSLPGSIAGVTLRAPNNGSDGLPTIFTLFDVSTPLDQLHNGGPRPDLIFNDLGSGTVYGAKFIASPSATPVTVDFTCAGLAAVQAALGQKIAVGGSYAAFPPSQFLFGGSPGAVQLLIQTTTDPLPTSTAIFAPPTSPTYGGTAVLQALLTSNGCPVANQPIAFSVNGSPVGSATTNNLGVATFSAQLGPLDVGTYPIQATFAGNTRYATSSGPGTLPIVKTAASILVIGGTFTYDALTHSATATIRGVFGEDLGAASITYTTLPSGPTSTTPPIDVGSYRIDASFAGNTNYLFGSNSSNTIVITAASTSTTVVGSPNPSNYDSPATFTATVAPVPDSGSVRFFDGATTISGPIPVDGSGRATFVTSALSTGAHTIGATYSGRNFTTSRGTTAQTVTAIVPVALGVTPTDPTMFVGDSLQLTATARYSDGTSRTWSGVDNWSAFKALDTPTSSSGAASLGGLLYVIGGDTSAGAVSAVQAYDPATNTWAPRKPMAFARHHLATAVVNGVIYAIGGSNGGNVNYNEAYEAIADTWTTLAPMPTAREARGAAVNGLVYVVGGNASGVCSNIVEAFNPATNSWITGLAPMPTPRCDMAVAALDGKIYAMGGRNTSGSVRYNAVDVYDPTTNLWSAETPFSVGRQGMAGGSLDGRLYIAGGFTGSARTGLTESFDPSTHTWAMRAPMPTPRDAVEGRFIDGVFYVAGGDDGAKSPALEGLRPQQFTWSSGSGAASVDSSGLATGLTPGTAPIFAAVGALSGSSTLTVISLKPSVDAGVDAAIDEGSTFTRAGSFTNPGAKSWTATVNYGDGTGTQPLTLAGKTFTLSHVYTDNGFFNVVVTVTNEFAGTGSAAFNVTVANVAPTVMAGGDATLNEGDGLVRMGSFGDPGADTWTATVDYGDRTGVQPLVLNNDKTFALRHVYADNGTYKVTVTVTDDDGGVGAAQFTVNVLNVAPTVNALTAAVLNEGDSFSQIGSFTDPGADTWTATVDYGDGSGTHALTLNADKTFVLSHTYADDGVYVVTVTVTDKDGQGGVGSVTVRVNNVNPSVVVGGDATLNEGGTLTRNGLFTDPGADTWPATVDFGDGSGSQPLALAAKAFTLTHLYPQDGLYTVTVTVTDDDGGVGTGVFMVAVSNVAPAFGKISLTAASVLENDILGISGSFSDPGVLDPHVLTVNWGDGSVEVVSPTQTAPGMFVFSASHRYLDDNPGGTPADVQPIVVRVTDDHTTSEATTSVTVVNVPPTIQGVTGPLAPVLLGSGVGVTASFTDPGTLDTHSCIVEWGDGGPNTALVAAGTGSGSCTLSHIYAGAGVYPVVVTVVDDDMGAATATLGYIVVYSPDGGFVTGGGWINSPAGALSSNPSLTGRANFGLNAKYLQGAPRGQTEFQFQNGRLNFHSTGYSWLVISGAAAEYEGWGTINGAGDYGFLVSIVDGKLAGTGVDRFRIEIWDRATGAVVYDNDRGLAENAAATMSLGNGSVVIHK